MVMFSEPILYESHMHTPLCKHARGEPEEYAAVAERRGLKGIVVTCHNPPIDGWAPRLRMDVDQFDEYFTTVERARQAWAGRVDVRLGLEVDFAPGMEAGIAQQLAQAEFHHVLGSVHPQMAEYKARYYQDGPVEFQRTYFEHLAMAAETGLFDTIAHPDLVKNEVPEAWDVDRLLDDIRRALDRIAATGVAMELNTSGLDKRVREMNPGLTILREMQVREIPVVIGADAHVPERVGDRFLEALAMLEQVGYSQVSFFLNRQRHDVRIETAWQSLQPVVAV